MASNQEIPIGDDDLDALMAELEAETSGLVTAPAVTAAAPAVTTVEESDDLDDLEKELAGELSAPTTPALVEKKEIEVTDIKKDDVDAEMAALEAELSDAPVKPVKKVVPENPALRASEDIPATIELPKEKPVSKPAPAPEPEPELEEPAHPNPKPRAPSLEFHIDVDEFRKETRVSETTLDDCFMQQAGLVATYVAQHAHSEAQAARVKLQVEIAEAKLYDMHRKELAKGADKVTEKMVENAVRTDLKYAAIQVRLIEAESIAAINKGLVESLKQRRDMLIQLGADRREDGKGTARILAAQANDTHVAARAAAAGAAARRQASED